MYNSTQMAPEVTALRMTRLQQKLLDTAWIDEGTDEFDDEEN